MAVISQSFGVTPSSNAHLDLASSCKSNAANLHHVILAPAATKGPRCGSYGNALRPSISQSVTLSC